MKLYTNKRRWVGTKVVHPKGGELQKAVFNPRPEEKLEREADNVLKAFPHMSRQQARLGLIKDGMAEVWLNSIYQVAVYRGAEADDLVHIDELKGRCTWLSIKRRDKRPVNNWQDMQTMKNRLVGKECDAFQIFPAESRMVNTANQYHLIVLPEGQGLPFGWGKRAVSTEDRSAKDHSSSQSFRGE